MFWTFAKRYLLNSEFEEIFFKNELIALRSKSSNGFLKLFFITLTTFLSLGIAIGSLLYLEDRMDNPLINLLNITPNNDNKIPENNNLTASDLKNKFNTSDVKSKFNIQELTTYGIDILYFFNEKGESYHGYIRTLSYSENQTLLNYLLKPENTWYKEPIPNTAFVEKFETGKGVIVTEQFIKDLGYELPKEQRKIKLRVYNNGKIYSVYKDILAVVKDISSPQNLVLDVLCSNRLYASYQSSSKNISTGNNHLYVTSSFEDTAVVKKVIAQIANTLEVRKEIFIINETLESFKYWIRDKEGKSFDKEKIVEKLNKIDNSYVFDMYNEWNISEAASNIVPDPQYLSIVFSNWTNVRVFSSYLREKYNIKLNMAQVEEKENFNFISRLTEIISFILFLFGLISILIYVVSLISTHIRENRATLGTFKAFGLPNNFLYRLYSKIIFSFLGLVLIPTFLIGTLLHFIINGIFQESSFFYFLHPYILIAAILFVGITYSYIRWLGINKILERTPGDLIYKRE